jgi:hypothetical protein
LDRIRPEAEESLDCMDRPGRGQAIAVRINGIRHGLIRLGVCE